MAKSKIRRKRTPKSVLKLPDLEQSKSAALNSLVIPGHGAVGGKADLTLFRDVLVEIRDKVAALKKQGKSLTEVVAAKPGARDDAVWGNLFQNPSDFVALVYQDV
jgi:hypothetical protein